MSDKKSEMLSTMGTIWEIVKNIWNAVLALGGTDEDMRNILKPSGGSKLVNALALVILGRAKVVVNEVSPDFNPDYWANFYNKYFDFPTLSPLDFSGIKIPKKPTKGNWRLLVVLQGLTNNLVYSACSKQFTCWCYVKDLDREFVMNERYPKYGTYAIWVRDTVEADEVYKNKSATMVRGDFVKTETLLERMLHELKYFMETDKHLDMLDITLCAGTSTSNGRVPNTRWCNSTFNVGNDYASNQQSFLSPREVVEA